MLGSNQGFATFFNFVAIWNYILRHLHNNGTPKAIIQFCRYIHSGYESDIDLYIGARRRIWCILLDQDSAFTLSYLVSVVTSLNVANENDFYV